MNPLISRGNLNRARQQADADQSDRDRTRRVTAEHSPAEASQMPLKCQVTDLSNMARNAGDRLRSQFEDNDLGAQPGRRDTQ